MPIGKKHIAAFHYKGKVSERVCRCTKGKYHEDYAKSEKQKIEINKYFENRKDNL